MKFKNVCCARHQARRHLLPRWLRTDGGFYGPLHCSSMGDAADLHVSSCARQVPKSLENESDDTKLKNWEAPCTPNNVVHRPHSLVRGRASGNTIFAFYVGTNAIFFVRLDHKRDFKRKRACIQRLLCKESLTASMPRGGVEAVPIKLRHLARVIWRLRPKGCSGWSCCMRFLACAACQGTAYSEHYNAFFWLFNVFIFT